MKPIALLDQPCQRRSPRTLGTVVGGGMEYPDGLGNLIVRYLNDPIGAAPDDPRAAVSGTRTAMPSAKVSAELVGMGRPAATERA
jgi:hypothetical protein